MFQIKVCITGAASMPLDYRTFFVIFRRLQNVKRFSPENTFLTSFRFSNLFKVFPNRNQIINWCFSMFWLNICQECVFLNRICHRVFLFCSSFSVTATWQKRIVIMKIPGGEQHRTTIDYLHR